MAPRIQNSPLIFGLLELPQESAFFETILEYRFCYMTLAVSGFSAARTAVVCTRSASSSFIECLLSVVVLKISDMVVTYHIDFRLAIPFSIDSSTQELSLG